MLIIHRRGRQSSQPNDVRAFGPTLPAGHPFTNVQSSGYRSASTFNPTLAWLVRFSNGDVDNDSQGADHLFWCVRGGGVLDNY